jgi:hypothetical protein
LVGTAEVAEVGEEAGAVLSGDRLGVELDAPLGAVAVFDGHWDSVAGGCLAQGARQWMAQGERVVTDSPERAGDACEERGAVVLDGGDAAVHGLGGLIDPSAFHPAQALQAEADAEQGAVAVADGVGADAEVLWSVRPPGARRDDDVVKIEARQLVPTRLVVADHERLAVVHLCQQLEEVVGEGVVVVDQERAHRVARVGKIPL